MIILQIHLGVSTLHSRCDAKCYCTGLIAAKAMIAILVGHKGYRPIYLVQSLAAS